MGKQPRGGGGGGGGKKPADNVGKGKVTPVQIAFIVDRYLHDSGYKQSRSAFRAEASSLLAKSPLHEAPKGLLTLDAMLNEYISLKEQKVAVDQERVQLEQERWRIQALLQGMQDAMSTYNASAGCGSPPTPAIPAPPVANLAVAHPPSNPSSGSPAGCPAYNTPSPVPPSMSSKVGLNPEKCSLPSGGQPYSGKRKGPNTSAEATSLAKKTRTLSSSSRSLDKSAGIIRQSIEGSTNQGNANLSGSVQSLTQKSVISGSLVQGSSIVKRLFNQPLPCTPKKSSGPKTPPQGISSVTDKSASSVEVSSNAGCSNNTTPQEATPTRCTVVSYERVTVSPYKQGGLYTIERSHCVSSTSPAKTDLKRLHRREHVKGRLDFDNPDVSTSLGKEQADNPLTSQSQSDVDIFDIDFPNLEAFGVSFSEFLVDFDFDYDGMTTSSQPTSDASPVTISESSPESRGNNLGAHQCLSESPGTVTEILSENDMNLSGLNGTMEFVTKHPEPRGSENLDQENYASEN
ncbi:uncharacterized protein LOC115672252 isoform X2 [Syzygium oleosum]|uniref:uncharacterized protein LOC115672252 isoform X2 n=1 Tax=Syzygium oleosum TaxID=219896 RepID=UPI0011D21A69|nr:uncharacterized protein LOC115672252 isoform X2 [Syzygium oleosum]